ncbi:MAG: sulfotransferase family protein [Alphaproteobacteria bacterium HGW-Alphaproteobacteria-12]|nr:MAG: sulfotransferase family protein [Alphaproteobacteria bacterium HGW-Alphaproteobacteria-12]
MALSVIGAGFGRTGTLSLKLALEQLGFAPCHHMLEVFANPGQAPAWLSAAKGEAVDWDALLSDYKASVDWPSCHFWRELAAHYPEAKVILSTRDPRRWYKSISETIFRAMEGQIPEEGPGRDVMAMARHIVGSKTFGGRTDEAHVLDVFTRHEAEVKRGIPAGRLLVFDVAEGWEPLCRFLGVPVPDAPFPRTNSSEEFQAHLQ